MAVPGRTLRCTGDPLENAHIIAAAFHADGYKDASPPDEFPLRLTSGSHALEVLGLSNEFFFPLLAIPGLRKRVIPTEVRIQHLGEDAEAVELRVETRARGAAQGHSPRSASKICSETL